MAPKKFKENGTKYEIMIYSIYNKYNKSFSEHVLYSQTIIDIILTFLGNMCMDEGIYDYFSNNYLLRYSVSAVLYTPELISFLKMNGEKYIALSLFPILKYINSERISVKSQNDFEIEQDDDGFIEIEKFDTEPKTVINDSILKKIVYLYVLCDHAMQHLKAYSRLKKFDFEHKLPASGLDKYLEF